MPEPELKPNAHQSDSVKATVESILIALILAFIFRAYVVEAFVIPTGSMAPTLLGVHLRVDDPQTGYTFAVNHPRHSVNQLAYDEDVLCPISQNVVTLPADRITRSGDRILVQKYIYTISEPRRWDVVVFKAPHQPQINYIKRLVALPGESVHLFDGNVFVSTTSGEDLSTYRIARKTDPQANHNWQRIQRRIWQPIYHSQYLPLEPAKARADGWSMPWKALTDGWSLDGRRSYRFEPSDPDQTGRIRFDFATMSGRTRLARLQYPYNQLMQSQEIVTPMEDVRLAVQVEPLSWSGSLSLQTTARLGNPDQPFEQVIAEIAMDGSNRVTLKAVPTDRPESPGRLLAQTQLESTGNGHVELWYVDQSALVFVDGEVVLRYELDLNLKQMAALPEPATLPQVGIDVTGPAVLHRVELDRDLYYLTGGDVRGGLYRNDQQQLRGNPAVRLLADEFYVLGDNSPQSQDSRLWPWEPDSNFEHRLIEGGYFSADGRDHAGIVPRGLLIGRAFFVYFPAPQRFGPQVNLPVLGERVLPIPNFGDMRFIW